METPGSGLVFSLRRVTRGPPPAPPLAGSAGRQPGCRPRGARCHARGAAEADIDAVVAIGEADARRGPSASARERLGRPGAAFKADVAADPVEDQPSRARPDQCAGRAGRGRPGRHDEPRPRLLYGEIRGERAGPGQDRSKLAGGEEAHHPARRPRRLRPVPDQGEPAQPALPADAHRDPALPPDGEEILPAAFPPDPSPEPIETLERFLERGRFSDFFVTYFMTPLVSAVWSDQP